MRANGSKALAAFVAAGVMCLSCSSDADSELADTTVSTDAAIDEPVATAADTTAAPTTTDTATTTSTSTSTSTSTTVATTTTTLAPSGGEFVDSVIEIEDPTVGSLTFDVRTAGDPTAIGQGKAVILLHGFPETNLTWDEVAAELAGAGYYAIAPNQRGYSAGARPEAVDQYAAPHLVDDVYALADALGAETFHIVGHDLGSFVAWSVAGREALEATGRVTSLTALSVGHPLAFTTARADPASDQGERSSYFDDFAAPNAQEPILADNAAFYRSLFDDAGYSDDELNAYLDALGTPEAMTSILHWFGALGMVGADSVQTIEVPTLFMWSTADVAMGREQAELTAGFVNGPYTFVEIPDVSHWIMHEEPALVAEAVLDHLATSAG